MGDIDYSSINSSDSSDSSRPQEGRSNIVRASIESLNSSEFKKMNRILDEHYSEKPTTILDQSLGEVINNTIHFFSNSVNSYYSKLMEAEFIYKLEEGSYIDKVTIHLLAMSLFIRDNDNIIYLGILMIILSVLICFFNISRSYGNE